VIPSEIGGGFGGKIVVYLEPIAILLSRKTNRPVKMVMSRDEVFRATGPTSGSKSSEVRREARRRSSPRACRCGKPARKGSPVGAGAMCARRRRELLHRGARRRRQQAEGGSCPAPAVAHGDVCDRVGAG
jgi:hypothetical protein